MEGKGFYWGDQSQGWYGWVCRLSYWSGWRFFRTLFQVAFRCRFCNPERVPQTGPVLLAANHASFFDPPLVGSGLHRLVHMLARDTLFRFPAGQILRSWKAIPVDRDGRGAAGLKRVVDCLNEGGAVLLFPEGTRTRDGQLQPARSGIGLVVLRSPGPVVPVRVFGSFEAFSRHHRLPRLKPLLVKYGTPLHFEALRREAQTCSKARLKEIYQEITDQIMAAIARLQPWQDNSTFP